MTTGVTSPPRRRRTGLRWWQLPIVVVTFPISLTIVLASAIWLRLKQLRYRRFLLGYALIWLIWGQAMVLFDSGSGTGWPYGMMSRLPAAEVLRTVPYQDGYAYSNPSWTCDPSDPVGGNRGGWPLGKPMVFVLACSAVAGREMLTRSGFPDAGQWIVRQYEWTLVDYQIDRRIGFSYLFMGLLVLIECVLAVPWLIAWGIWQVLRHIHIGWR